MPLSPYDVLAPYQKLDKTRRLDRWTELQTAPPVQKALTLDPPSSPTVDSNAEDAFSPSSVPDAPALALNEEELPAAKPAVAPESVANPTPAAPPSVPVSALPPHAPRRFYADIIKKHNAAAAHCVLTPATPHP